MIRAHEVSVCRKGQTLLGGVSLQLNPGELTVLLGPNGAGKSTLLRVLAGEWRADSGEVRLHGHLLAHWRAEALAKLRAVLPQETPLSFPLTALQVVMLGRHPHNDGWPDRHDGAIARHALGLTDTAHLAERTYPTLSGGERARVQLARCLCQIWEPQTEERYLLLDEPTASLDPAHQHLALQAVREFVRESGAAACVVLHDLNLAAQYGDRIAILQGGRLAVCGTPWEVLTVDWLAGIFRVDAEVLRLSRCDRPLIATTGASVGNQPAVETRIG